MMALNCQPVIETASTRIILDCSSKRVLSYKVLDTLYAYKYVWNAPWTKYRTKFYWDGPVQKLKITVSHGVLFKTALLGAADVRRFGGNSNFDSAGDGMEDTSEQSFNFRQTGLNVDYMTYSMLSLQDFGHRKLLDAAVLERTAQCAFSTIYKHLVNK
ncbi:hypothetical protein F5B22DRAFT_376490 [Xylaria bambusicola]|uniref:uncharacterized protein n=1 Tax=Xylaria bambusicola TaxID=326684 RepID=UPI0020086328|nr:uncharacterized protein F5B22DRAFT_376490 [Xylaria bambusicola]KAI0509017.1 hypothetical protein F5B22DRAFT_376490 [Xylaria bambusicola]